MRIRFGSGSDADGYLSADEALPDGLVLTRDVDAGELLPRAALGNATDADLVEVPLTVPTGGVSATLSVGDIVDVWVTGKDAQDAVRALRDVRVLAVPNDSSAFSSGADRQVVVGVGADDEADLPGALAMLATGTAVVTKQPADEGHRPAGRRRRGVGAGGAPHLRAHSVPAGAAQAVHGPQRPARQRLVRGRIRRGGGRRCRRTRRRLRGGAAASRTVGRRRGGRLRGRSGLSAWSRHRARAGRARGPAWRARGGRARRRTRRARAAARLTPVGSSRSGVRRVRPGGPRSPWGWPARSPAGHECLLLDVDAYGGAVAQHLGVLDEVSGLLAAARAANAGQLDEDRLSGLVREGRRPAARAHGAAATRPVAGGAGVGVRGAPRPCRSRRDVHRPRRRLQPRGRAAGPVRPERSAAQPDDARRPCRGRRGPRRRFRRPCRSGAAGSRARRAARRRARGPAAGRRQPERGRRWAGATARSAGWSRAS